MQIPVPDLGYVIGCWYPDTDIKPYTRGDKFRPSIVLAIRYDILEKHPIVTVCYGTGQSSITHRKQKSSYWMEMAPDPNKNNFKYITRFYLDDIANLPFTPEFFESKHQKNHAFDYFGKLDLAQTQQVNDILNSISAANTPASAAPKPVSAPANPTIITYKKFRQLVLQGAPISQAPSP